MLLSRGVQNALQSVAWKISQIQYVLGPFYFALEIINKKKKTGSQWAVSVCLETG